jgi:hypothetical protein
MTACGAVVDRPLGGVRCACGCTFISSSLTYNADAGILISLPHPLAGRSSQRRMISGVGTRQMAICANDRWLRKRA